MLLQAELWINTQLSYIISFIGLVIVTRLDVGYLPNTSAQVGIKPIPEIPEEDRCDGLVAPPFFFIDAPAILDVPPDFTEPVRCFFVIVAERDFVAELFLFVTAPFREEFDNLD